MSEGASHRGTTRYVDCEVIRDAAFGAMRRKAVLKLFCSGKVGILCQTVSDRTDASLQGCVALDMHSLPRCKSLTDSRC